MKKIFNIILVAVFMLPQFSVFSADKYTANITTAKNTSSSSERGLRIKNISDRRVEFLITDVSVINNSYALKALEDNLLKEFWDYDDINISLNENISPTELGKVTGIGDSQTIGIDPGKQVTKKFKMNSTELEIVFSSSVSIDVAAKIFKAINLSVSIASSLFSGFGNISKFVSTFQEVSTVGGVIAGLGPVTLQTANSNFHSASTYFECTLDACGQSASIYESGKELHETFASKPYGNDKKYKLQLASSFILQTHLLYDRGSTDKTTIKNFEPSYINYSYTAKGGSANHPNSLSFGGFNNTWDSLGDSYTDVVEWFPCWNDKESTPYNYI